LGITSTSLAQERRVWQIEKQEQAEREKQRLDSIAVQNQAYLPAATINLKSQFPIQHAIGLEFNTPIYLSTYIGIGQLSRAYLVTATNFLPEDDPAQAIRKQFIKDKLKNGFVLELGTHYHFSRRRHFYAGLNLQFQRFTLPATPQELAEEYDFGDAQGFTDDIQSQLDDNAFLQNFYENTVIEPVIRPIQLGLTLGKKFYFKKASRLFLDVEFSYQFNISNNVKIKSESFIGQILLDNFIAPILDEGSNDSFQGFNLPSLSFRIGYQLGEKIYRKPQVL
jgi:hypothetical protein